MDPSRAPWRLRGLPSASLLGIEVPLAARLRARLLGLSLLRRERAGAGLLIDRCSSVHSFARQTSAHAAIARSISRPRAGVTARYSLAAVAAYATDDPRP